MEGLFIFLLKQTSFNPKKWWTLMCLFCLFMIGFNAQPVDVLNNVESLQAHNFNTNITFMCNKTYCYCNNVSQLTSIPTGIFATVLELNFNNNGIKRIQENDFNKLELLQIICLGNNSITNIHPNSFRNLYKLQTLNLEGNQLTTLDPSGLIFQHLVSLRNLYLQNNRIVTVSKYAFLTLAASGNLVSISMDHNPVRCDCDTWALKNWADSLKERTVQISLQCENDDQRRSFKEVEDSVFGSCNSSQNGVFNDVTECFFCTNVTTNYECTSKPQGKCINPNQVCQKSVKWYETNMSMEITSKCEIYQKCLNYEARNAETCDLGMEIIGNVTCDFCCRGPTCLNNSIGGRTTDFTFFLIIQGVSSLQAPINLTPLPGDIKKAILLNNTLFGGIDVTVYESTTPKNQNSAVLQIRLTIFTNTKEYVHAVISQALEKDHADPHSFLKKQGVVSFKMSSYLEGMECDIKTDFCPATLNCLSSQGNITRCLCDESSFFKLSKKTCLPVAELKVKNLSSSSSSPNTVMLTWTAEKHETSVKYTVQSSPTSSQVVVDSVSASGARVSGLRPATLYNFTVTSTLTKDFYTKIVSSSISGVWTMAAHGNFCDPIAPNVRTCAGANIQCMTSPTYEKRCLCSSSYYFSIYNTCREMSELRVKNLTAPESTADTITLTWTEDSHAANVSYMLRLIPGELEVKVSSGATWRGLHPGTQYSFVVTSILFAGDFYADKSVNSTITGVWTKAVYGNSCIPYDSGTGNICAGTNIQCIPSKSGPRCLCSSTYYFSNNNTCRKVKDLQVQNLTASASTNDTVTLTWIAQKHGANVSYTIQPVPGKGHLVVGSLSASGATWTGLDPGTQYNFIVTSILPADDLYQQRSVNSTITGVWTKTINKVTVFISYTKQNATYETFMANSSSEGYLEEEERIVAGVKSAISGAVNLTSICVDQFISTNKEEYIVLLKIEVITFGTETIERAINDAIQNNTEDPDGFFFNEQLKSLEVFSKLPGSYPCPYSVTSLEKGVIKWEAANLGWQCSPCPYHYPLDNSAPNATRECLSYNGTIKWGEVNDSLCANKEDQVNPDNARNVSSDLKTYTNQFNNFTVEMMNKAVNLLEQLTTEEMLAQPGVATNVMDSVNNLINVDIKTLQDAEKETAASRRLLSVINSVSNKTPFTEDILKLVTSNLAVAAHKVNSSDTEDIALVSDTDSGSRQNDNRVNIDFPGKSPLPETRTSIVIPVKALFASLTPAERNQVERISFIVHRTDILFASIEKAGVTESPMKVTTRSSVTEKKSDNRSEGDFFIMKINSQVISASVPGVRVQNLTRNITMTFEHYGANATNARCVFWDESMSNNKGGWSDRGCGIVHSLAGSTTCGCNHLTNFALLMDVYGGGSKLSELDRKILSIISYVGCGISFVALILTLIIYSGFRSMRRDNPSKILINLCFALLCSNLVFLVGMHDYTFGNIASCKAVAVLLHYFLLASLCWMAVEAFYMYLALVLVFKTYFTNFILKCSLVGWGVPLAIIIITLAVNTTDNYGFINSGLCWLKNPAFYGAFVGPVCLILLINCLAFLLVIKQLVSMSSNELHKSDKNSTFQRLRGAVGVVILLGLSWIFAIFAIDQASVVFYYLFAIFNSLQGLFIFIFYCVLKKDTVQTLKRHLPCFEEYGDSSKSYTNSRGIHVKSGGHKLAEHKLISSKHNGNTNSTNSTSPDSRKDSCFSTLSSSNTFDGSQNGRLHDSPETDMDTTGTPQLNNYYINGDLQAYTTPQSDHPVRRIDNTKQDSLTVDTPRNTTPEKHHSNDSYTIDTLQNSAPEENLISGSHTIQNTHQNSAPEGNLISGSHTIQNTHQNSAPEENLISGSHTIQHTHQNSAPEENLISSGSHTILHTHQNSTPEEKSVGDTHTIDTHQNSASEEELVSGYEHLSDNSSDSVNSEDNLLPSPSLPAETSSNIQQTLNESSLKLESQQKSFPGISQQPSSPDISQRPSSPDISQRPSSPEFSQRPSSPEFSQQPSSPDISQRPSSPDISQRPSSPDISQRPSSPEFSQRPSSPDISQRPTSPANSPQAKAMLNPSFAPFTAQGEIDYSHMPSVVESKKKFEWSISEISESSDIHSTKI